jgi:putative membrane protein
MLLVRILLIWASNTIAIFVADWLIDGISIDGDHWRLILAGAVFGLINFLVKPIVTLLALPVIVLTLGIALFFVNLLMLYITSWLVSGFEIDSFGAAVLGTIVIWFVNLILYAVFGLNDWSRKRETARRR